MVDGNDDVVVDGNDDVAAVGTFVCNAVGYGVGEQVSATLQLVPFSPLQDCIAVSNLYPSGQFSNWDTCPLVHKAYSLQSGRGR